MKTFARIFRWCLIIGALGGAIYLVAWSNILVVKSIEITGTTDQNSISLILEESKPAIHIGEPLARIDVKAIDKKLTEVNWIERSNISRNWFSRKLSVAITVRSAVAQFVDGRGQINYFDAAGAVFTHIESSGTLPTVSLADQSTAIKSAVATMLSQLSPELISSATAFIAKSSDDLEMRTGPGAGLLIKWGDATNFPLKMSVYKKLISLPENQQATLLDLSTPLAPIAK